MGWHVGLELARSYAFYFHLRHHATTFLPTASTLHCSAKSLQIEFWIGGGRRMLMSHSKSSNRLAEFGFLRAVLCLLVAVALLAPGAHGQQAPESCSISGTARDTKGPIANVTLRLTSKDDDRTYEARTNSQGKYQFSALHPGVFMLHAEVAGFVPLDLPPVFVSRDENKTVDFTLQHTQAAPSATPEFYDEPQFNVAGVTDT